MRGLPRIPSRSSKRLQSPSSSRALNASLNLADAQHVANAGLLKMLAPTFADDDATSPTWELNAPFVQREELLSAVELEENRTSTSLGIHSMSAFAASGSGDEMELGSGRPRVRAARLRHLARPGGAFDRRRQCVVDHQRRSRSRPGIRTRGQRQPGFLRRRTSRRNLFANSVVALRASTGHIVWHFQAVHHDLWDYDIPAQPVLFSLRRGGREIPALAQPTKMGFLFVLNRETGEPLFPVDERPVPASDVAGEEAWPTQPFPTRPPPLVPVRLTADDAFGVSADSRAWCRERIASLRSEGIFTPPSVRGSIAYPGNVGGSNWSGAAFDPVRRLAFLPLNRLATVIELIPRDQYRDAQRRSGRDYEVAPQAGTPFAMRRQTMAAPDGVPCTPPPFGTMTAVDLDSGEVKWSVPFGRVSRFAHLPGSESWGSPSLGGSLATAGGLVFAGGTMDQRIRALDAQTGAEVWSYEMPAGVHAAPMTYRYERRPSVSDRRRRRAQRSGDDAWRLRRRLRAA